MFLIYASSYCDESFEKILNPPFTEIDSQKRLREAVRMNLMTLSTYIDSKKYKHLVKYIGDIFSFILSGDLEKIKEITDNQEKRYFEIIDKIESSPAINELFYSKLIAKS